MLYCIISILIFPSYTQRINKKDKWINKWLTTVTHHTTTTTTVPHLQEIEDDRNTQCQSATGGVRQGDECRPHDDWHPRQAGHCQVRQHVCGPDGVAENSGVVTGRTVKL